MLWDIFLPFNSFQCALLNLKEKHRSLVRKNYRLEAYATLLSGGPSDVPWRPGAISADPRHRREDVK